MNAIHLLPVGSVPAARSRGNEVVAGLPHQLLDTLTRSVEARFRQTCTLSAEPLDPGFAFDPSRNQYFSTAILQELDGRYSDRPTRILGVTAEDLFVPVLTFVFGEAQLGGRAALVSLHRLREEFYGLPPDGGRLRDRLEKEAIHELGHTFGLRHCANWECVMASTHTVERLDVKRSEFCQGCMRLLQPALVACGLP